MQSYLTVEIFNNCLQHYTKPLFFQMFLKSINNPRGNKDTNAEKHTFS